MQPSGQPIYFLKKDIDHIRNVLIQMGNESSKIIINGNTLIMAIDYDDYTDVEQEPINESITDGAPYSDINTFSLYSGSENNLYMKDGKFKRVEVRRCSFTIEQDGTIFCECDMKEVDDQSIMYDQLAYGYYKFQINNNQIIYLEGQCEDRYGDGYRFSADEVSDIINVLHPYWHY